MSGERDFLGDANIVQNCARSYYRADPFWVHPHLPMKAVNPKQNKKNYIYRPMARECFFLCIFKGCILLMVYLRLRTPIHLSTTDLVVECMVLYLRSWSVVGAISGVISHRFSGYPLSPRSSPLHL